MRRTTGRTPARLRLCLVGGDPGCGAEGVEEVIARMGVAGPALVPLLVLLLVSRAQAVDKDMVVLIMSVVVMATMAVLIVKKEE